MVDVFISYPRALREKVQPIKAKLEALGLDCFYDLEGIDGGAEFPAVIDRAVKSAKAVLGCWSPSAFTRPWVMQECRVAHARNVLVPVAIERFDGLAVPTEFFGVNYLDLVDWNGTDAHEGWQRVLASLGRLVERQLATATGKKHLNLASSGQPRSEILADLRTTWAVFPAKENQTALAEFLNRIRAVAPGSGLEFEVEFHLDECARVQTERQRAAAAQVEAQERKDGAAVVTGTWRGELHYPGQVFVRKWTLSSDGSFQSQDAELGFVEHGTWKQERSEVVVNYQWGTTYRGRVSGQSFLGKIHPAKGPTGTFVMQRVDHASSTADVF